MADAISSSERYDIFNSLLGKEYVETSPMEFYRELFPIGCLQSQGVYNDGKYCAIAIAISNDDDGKIKRRSITDGLECLNELLSSDDFTIISPVSYAGKTRSQKNARELYAIQVDMDGVYIRDGIPYGLTSLFKQAKNGFIPQPTYCCVSGSNLHLYYFLDEPIRLFPSVIESLNKFRDEFIGWNLYNADITTLHDSPQVESVTQGMRAIGTICKNGLQRVRAYKTGERVSVDELNKYVKEENHIKLVFPKMTIDEAKQKYPEWYERINSERETNDGWHYSRAMYDHWVNELKTKCNPGHRYYGIMTLTVYAQKCGISENELFNTAMSLVETLDAKTTDPENHFTKQDVLKALEYYNHPHIKMTKRSVERLSGIKINPKTKRRPKGERLDLQTHVAYMREVKRLKMIFEPKNKRIKGGRPNKRQLIVDYLKENPTANNSEIAKGLGISRTTVIKYRNGINENEYISQNIEENDLEQPTLFDIF